MADEASEALRQIVVGGLGRDMAYHLVLERLLVRVFKDDAAGFEAFAHECTDAIDATLEGDIKGETGHLSAHHTMGALETLFGGARGLLASDEQSEP